MAFTPGPVSWTYKTYFDVGWTRYQGSCFLICFTKIWMQTSFLPLTQFVRNNFLKNEKVDFGHNFVNSKRSWGSSSVIVKRASSFGIFYKKWDEIETKRIAKLTNCDYSIMSILILVIFYVSSGVSYTMT